MRSCRRRVSEVTGRGNRPRWRAASQTWPRSRRTGADRSASSCPFGLAGPGVGARLSSAARSSWRSLPSPLEPVASCWGTQRSGWAQRCCCCRLGGSTARAVVARRGASSAGPRRPRAGGRSRSPAAASESERTRSWRWSASRRSRVASGPRRPVGRPTPPDNPHGRPWAPSARSSCAVSSSRPARSRARPDRPRPSCGRAPGRCFDVRGAPV